MHFGKRESTITALKTSIYATKVKKQNGPSLTETSPNNSKKPSATIKTPLKVGQYPRILICPVDIQVTCSKSLKNYYIIIFK